MSITAEPRASKTQEPESRPVKFLFDDEFGDGRARSPRARVSAAEHAAAVKEAEAEGYRRGFAEASLHQLEVATGVNKSGLYSEFKDKEDLFVQSLPHYLESLEKKGLLTAEPLGWNNIERFLKMGPCSMEGQKGCFAVSSMREFAILPPEAVGIITRSRSKLKQLIAKNIEVERPKMNADSLAELVLTFFTGLSMEHNLSSSRPSIIRKIDDLMNIVRTL